MSEFFQSPQWADYQAVSRYAATAAYQYHAETGIEIFASQTPLSISQATDWTAERPANQSGNVFRLFVYGYLIIAPVHFSFTQL